MQLRQILFLVLMLLLAGISCSSSNPPNEAAGTTTGVTGTTSGGVVCMPAPEFQNGDQAVYTIQQTGKSKRLLLLEVVERNSDVTRFNVTDDAAVYEAYILHRCVGGPFSDDFLTSTSNNFNFYNDDSVLFKILVEPFGAFILRSQRPNIVSQTEINCSDRMASEFSAAFNIFECDRTYTGTFDQGSEISISSNTTNFNVSGRELIVDESHAINGSTFLTIRLDSARIGSEDFFRN